jgi:multimeric flavodoxin WrbA
MKIIAILGSPRKNGNSEVLAQTVAGTIAEKHGAEIVYLRTHTLDISGCIGCGGCEKTGMCVIRDDMTDVYEQVDQADIILLVTPVYFYGPSSQVKTVIDRFQARWSRKYLLKTRYRRQDKRIGCLLSTAATQGKKLFDGSTLIARSFFDAIDVEYSGACTIRGVDEKGALSEQPEQLLQAKAFADGIMDNL